MMNNIAPCVSVIIPAYYSEASIGECLSALAAQTLRDFEVIVVNSSPEDRTRQVVIAEFPGAIFRQNPTRLLPHAARNVGFALARGELLVTTDPDCIPDSQWLANLAQAAKGYPIIQGSVEPVGAGWLERGIHLCKRFSLLSQLPSYSPWIVSTINVCYTRSVWQAAGPFDGELYCGDAVLGWRAAALGYRAQFEPRAVVRNRHRERLASLIKVRFTRGEEFAHTRSAYEKWSRSHAALYVLSLPLLFALVSWQSFRSACKAGWVKSFVATLPVHFAGQIAWLVGESQAYFGEAAGLRKQVAKIVREPIALEKNVRLGRSHP